MANYQWPMSGRYKLVNRDSVRALRRLRTAHSFIVDNRDFPELACAACGEPIAQPRIDNGRPVFDNRAHYFPKAKTLQVLHYSCAWSRILARIDKLDGQIHA